MDMPYLRALARISDIVVRRDLPDLVNIKDPEKAKAYLWDYVRNLNWNTEWEDGLERGYSKAQIQGYINTVRHEIVDYVFQAWQEGRIGDRSE